MIARSKINHLLTKREGHTGEYWPEVVAVWTEQSEVRTATTEGQYSPVRPEQARLVSCLLYGTLFLIVKCTSGAINLFIFLAFRSFYLSIFLASSGSFTVKNVNIHSFFFAVLVANYEFASFAPKQKYTAWTVSTEMVHTAKSRPRKNQSERWDLPKTGFAI